MPGLTWAAVAIAGHLQAIAKAVNVLSVRVPTAFSHVTQVTNMEFCPGYFDELVGPTRARYEAKIDMCNGVDPYKLHIGRDATKDAELLPPTTHVDIINYLVLSTSYISLQQMKAYKALDAHNYFTSGFVKNIAAKQLPSQRVVVLAEVSVNSSSGRLPTSLHVLTHKKKRWRAAFGFFFTL